MPITDPIGPSHPPAATQHPFPFGAPFWTDIAALLLQRPALESWVVIVPSLRHGTLLRDALAVGLRAAGRAALRLPRIAILADWLLEDTAADGATRSSTARRIELYQALKGTEWLARHLAAARAPLWALSRQLLGLCDELTLGLARSARDAQFDVIEARIMTALQDVYPHFAWSSLSPEAQLVFGVWRATASCEDGPARLLRRMEHLAQRAHAPLLVILAEPPKPYEEAFLSRYAERATVERITIDVTRSLSSFFPLTAAWPELHATAGSAPPPNLLTRAKVRPDAAKPLSNLRLVGTHNLEEAAVCAAQTALDWLAQGATRIGLIALDRLVARRVRALLERAEVLVEDEAGWKFSTTTAAGALMRWLEIAGPDPSGCEARTLLDWVKSPYAWSTVPEKEAITAELELAIRRHNVVSGWSRIESAVASERQAASRPAEVDEPDAQVRAMRADHLATAAAQIARLRQLAVPLRGRRSLVEHFRWLDQVLEATEMASRLLKDGVGRAMLQLFAEVATQAGENSANARFDYSEWRDFVSDVLESSTYRDRTVTSSVVACSLRAAALRPFDGILILGADASHLPSATDDALFITPALRAQLGLEDTLAQERQELTQLALLIAATPKVVCTWQTTKSGEACALAPALERLSMLHKMAFGDDLKQSFEWPSQPLAKTLQYLPRPNAPERVPAQVSASAYNMLTSCPYRYFVRYMMGLTPLEETREDADKRDYGTLVHRIFERYHEDAHTPQTRSEEIERLRRVGADVFAASVGENAAFFGYRQRWEGLVESYVDWWLEWSHEGWKFSAGELYAETSLALAADPPLSLVGRLDRLDVAQERVAILDYKARSTKALKDALRIPGEDVQLPFYRLLEREKPQASAFYLSVDRDKVEAVAPAGLDALSDALEQRLVRDFDRLRAGAPLPAHGADSVCVYCDARGLCRKGHWSEAGAGPQPDPTPTPSEGAS